LLNHDEQKSPDQANNAQEYTLTYTETSFILLYRERDMACLTLQVLATLFHKYVFEECKEECISEESNTFFPPIEPTPYIDGEIYFPLSWNDDDQSNHYKSMLSIFIERAQRDLKRYQKNSKHHLKYKDKLDECTEQIENLRKKIQNDCFIIRTMKDLLKILKPLVRAFNQSTNGYPSLFSQPTGNKILEETFQEANMILPISERDKFELDEIYNIIGEEETLKFEHSYPILS
jgi:hypothetical protein